MNVAMLHAEIACADRFAVEAYPSIFLVEGGSTRMFTGMRSVDQVPISTLAE